MAAEGVNAGNLPVEIENLSPGITSIVPSVNEDRHNGLTRATNVELLPKLADDYSSLLAVTGSKEIAQFNDTVDDLLTKLDEFLCFADMIRGDINLALGTTLGAIHTKTNEMKDNFDRIDKLEVFVGVVKGNLATIEAQVNQAEIDLGTLNPIKKVFHSLPSIFSPKPTLQRSARQADRMRYKSPNIFRTTDYFGFDAASVTSTIQSDRDRTRASSADVQITAECADLTSLSPIPQITPNTAATDAAIAYPGDSRITTDDNSVAVLDRDAVTTGDNSFTALDRDAVKNDSKSLPSSDSDVTSSDSAGTDTAVSVQAIAVDLIPIKSNSNI